jgi:exodeoxyribonuclease VII large subunit
MLALSQRGPQLGAPARLRLTAAASALHALSPLAVLARGFAIVHDTHGRVLRDAAHTAPGDELSVRLATGSLRTRVLAQGE